jgi:sarcosine oxidase
VLAIDRYDPPHEQGSTLGESRITRCAVGEGPEYAPFVIAAQKIWRELEQATGEKLMDACGCLIIGPPEARAAYQKKPHFMAKTLEVAKTFGIEHEVLSRADIARRFPQFTQLGPQDIAFFEPGGGAADPEACVRAQIAEGKRLGGTLLANTAVHGFSQSSGSMQISTSAGTFEAGHAVVAAGAWNGAILGPPFDRMLRVTPQTLYWFETSKPAYTVESCPVFIHSAAADPSGFFYGCPTPAGSRSVKVATEQDVIDADPDSVSRQVSAAQAKDFYDRFVAPWLADVSPRLIAAKVCLYTSSEAGGCNFLIDRHPEMDRLIVVSACSGHGFKHSAAIGRKLAHILADVPDDLDISPFGLARFAAGAG